MLYHLIFKLEAQHVKSKETQELWVLLPPAPIGPINTPPGDWSFGRDSAMALWPLAFQNIDNCELSARNCLCSYQ